MLVKGGGGFLLTGGKTTYRRCHNEDCSSFGRVARIHTPAHSKDEQFAGWVDEDIKISPKESRRLLRWKVRDDLEWFGFVSDETISFAHQVFHSFF